MTWPLTPQDVVQATATVFDVPRRWLFLDRKPARLTLIKDVAQLLLEETGMSRCESAEFLCRDRGAKTLDGRPADPDFVRVLSVVREVAESIAERRRLAFVRAS